jgi:hypothetical protein
MYKDPDTHTHTHARRPNDYNTWTEKGVLKREPSFYTGVCVLKGDAMKVVGAQAHVRRHMHMFFRDQGAHALPSMRPSRALEAIYNAREARVYGSAPWRNFWENRSQYASAISSQQKNTYNNNHKVPAAQGLVGYAQKRPQPRSDSRHSSGAPVAKADNVAEAAERKLRKYILEQPTAAKQHFASLDAAGTGAVTADALRSWLIQCDAGLNEAEIAALMHAEDPHAGGVILYHHVLKKYGPPQADLARIAQERQKLGVYMRLRDREQTIGQSSAHALARLQQQPAETRQTDATHQGARHYNAQQQRNTSPRQHISAPAPAQQDPIRNSHHTTSLSEARRTSTGTGERGEPTHEVQHDFTFPNEWQQRLASETSEFTQLLRSGRQVGPLEPFYQETVEQLRPLLTR